MANPENVKTSQTFNLHKVIYNQDDFSIAVGTILGNENWLLAMRWNGHNEEAVGFPYAGKHPLWFVVQSADLSFGFLTSLLNSADITKENYKSILECLKDYEHTKHTD